MLNPDLKLNEKMFDTDVEQQPTRQGYGEGLVIAGEKNPNVVVLTADLSESTRANLFEEKFPDRFFDCGVAEQNMAAVAAGLGVSGKVAFISSYATFSPGKNWETIRTTIIYNHSNVKIAGHHAGVMTGPDGATHQATEDIAITRAWPKMIVVNPCDSEEAKKATINASEIEDPVYLRFTRDKTPIMTSPDTPFELGKIQTFWVSDTPQVAIYATGYMLFYALLAAKELDEEGLQTLVANVSTIKPLDENAVIEHAQKTNAIVTVEDHQVDGGMGSAIAEHLAKNHPTPMEFIGLQNTFAESASPKEIIEKYNMGKEGIKQAVKKVLSRKR